MLKNLYVNNDYDIRINKNNIHKLLNILKNELNFKIESVIFNFIDANNIHEINVEYLKHDCSTDIITFNYSGDHENLDGEIFISVDDALYYAKRYKNTLSNELLRLTIHGVLHLLGYDDMNKDDKLIMKRKENQLVKKFNEIEIIKNDN